MDLSCVRLLGHIDGNTKSVGRAFFKLQILDEIRYVQAEIMKNFPHQLLLGIDIGESFNFKLDWSTRTLSVGLGPPSTEKHPLQGPPHNTSIIIKALEDASKIKYSKMKPLSETVMALNIPEHEPSKDLISSEDLQRILNSHSKVFAKDDEDLGTITVEEHRINTTSSHPVYVPQFRLSQKDNDLINEQVLNLLRQDRVQPTTSRWNTPVFLVPKKDGSKRLIQDLRRVNDITKLERFPIPLIEEVIDRLQGSTCISTLDIAWGYWQVPIHPSDRMKTAFTAINGRYEWKVMTMGLKNAPFTFQMIMQMVLKDLLFKCAIPYLDDVVIFSKSVEDHKKDLESVFSSFINHNIKLRKEKCSFFKSHVEYLGFIVSGYSYRPSSRIIRAISEFPRPSSTKQIQRFIGMCNWLRKHIRSFSELSAQMTSRQANGTKFEWNEDLEKEFKALKIKAAEAVELVIYDPSLPLELHTDASSIGIGAALFQVGPNGLDPIGFYSKKLNQSQGQWSASHLESYAVLLACEHFQVYLLNGPFKLVTDHSALRWMRDQSMLKGKLHRWFIRLSSFDYTIEHRKGTQHSLVDALSRGPVEPSSEDLDTFHQGPQLSAKEEVYVIAPNPVTEDLIRSEQQKEDLSYVKRIFEWNGLKCVMVHGVRRIIIPKVLRRISLQYFHENFGHPGTNKVIHLLLDSKYWWPNYIKDASTLIDHHH